MDSYSLDEVMKNSLDAAPPRLGFAHWHGDIRLWQQTLRTELIDLLHVPVPAFGIPEHEIIAADDCGTYQRRTVVIRAADGLRLPAHVLIPHNLNSPAPVALCFPGHGPGKALPAGMTEDENGEPITISGDRDYALQAVRQGYVALSVDLRGFGELRLEEDIAAGQKYSCQRLSRRLQAVGKTLLGMRVSDVMCWINWLAALDEADASRIVVTGNSAGGTLSFWAAALDTRIAQAAPSCSWCLYRQSWLGIRIPSELEKWDIVHCECGYVPGLLTLCELTDVAGLIAPRPLLLIAGRGDNLAPVAAVQEAFEELRTIYAAFGAENALELFIGEGGHRYYKARTWDFFAAHMPER